MTQSDAPNEGREEKENWFGPREPERINMTFKQGKFYKGDEVIPLEFGNQEQVRIIESIKSMKEEGVLYLLSRSQFVCFCGELHIKVFADGKKFKCDCGAKYQFSFYETDYDYLPILKMI